MRFLLLAAAMLTLSTAIPTIHAQEVQSHPGHGEHAHDIQRQPEHPPAIALPSIQQDKSVVMPAGPHGGVVQQAGDLQIETVIESGGLQLFAYGHTGQSLELAAARGLATLKVDGSAKRFRYDLFPEIGKNRSATSLAVAVDLSQFAGKTVDVTLQLVGVPSAERSPVHLTVTSAVPMTKAQVVAAAMDVQKNCPVSGQPLGSMGKPIAMSIRGQTIYVCCEGCIAKVNANPEKYLPPQPLRLTAAPATAADAGAIKRQELCPVMDEPLGEMGVPLRVTGLGQDVFLCCKGCLKLLEKEPEKYLKKLRALPQPAKPKVTKATEADARFVAAQRICPVMDEPLNAMGGPFKTVVNGKIIFICCPGCATKLHASPDAYLQKLAQQGVTPPFAR